MKIRLLGGPPPGYEPPHTHSRDGWTCSTPPRKVLVIGDPLPTSGRLVIKIPWVCTYESDMVADQYATVRAEYITFDAPEPVADPDEAYEAFAAITAAPHLKRPEQRPARERGRETQLELF